MSRRSRRRWLRNIRPLFTVYLPVLPYVLFALFPLYFMLVTSLKSNAELLRRQRSPLLDRARAHRRPLHAPVDGYAVLELVRQQPDCQLGVDGDLGRLGRSRRVP